MEGETYIKKEEECQEVIKYIKSEEEYHKILEKYEYVFVVYSAVWCGPCRHFKDFLFEEYKSYPHPIVIVDVDEFEDLSEGISGLPTMIGFHNKEEFVRTVGFDRSKLTQIFNDIKDKIVAPNYINATYAL